MKLRALSWQDGHNQMGKGTVYIEPVHFLTLMWWLCAEEAFIIGWRVNFHAEIPNKHTVWEIIWFMLTSQKGNWMKIDLPMHFFFSVVKCQIPVETSVYLLQCNYVINDETQFKGSHLHIYKKVALYVQRACNMGFIILLSKLTEVSSSKNYVTGTFSPPF